MGCIGERSAGGMEQEFRRGLWVGALDRKLGPHVKILIYYTKGSHGVCS